MMRCEMVAASHQTSSIVGPRMIPNAAIGFISSPNIYSVGAIERIASPMRELPMLPARPR